MTRGLVACIALAACAAPTATVDWTHPPAVAAAPAVTPPRATSFVLAGGLRVVLVENHRLPLVAIAAVNLAAGSREDGERHGLAALTADLLVAGAGARDRAGVEAALESAGARLDVDIATDAATLELQARPAHLPEALDVLADALRRPRFDEAELVHARTARARRIGEHRATARTAAAQRFDALVFAGHPYAHAAEGDPDIVETITLAEIRAFHARAYGPAATAIVVAGDLDRATLEPALAARFADWTSPAHRRPAAAVPAPPAPAIAFVDRPGATTAVIVAGGRGQAASAPDRIAAELANTALGGAPTARLDRRFHDELGLSLAASSSFWRGTDGGSWAVATTVRTADAPRAIAELRAQLAAARATGFSPAELATARTQLLRALPRAFETDLGTARALERLVVQDLPLDYFTTFGAALARVTPEAARRAIEPLWTEPLVIVVGDRAALEAP